MGAQPPRGRVVLSFGRFVLVPSERLLTADGAPIPLGARAMDTLITLTSRPNEVFGKRELMAAVWPDVTVDEGSLRFHIAGLRKALGDREGGGRYIATLSGRGYCFVAPLARTETPPEKPLTGAPPPEVAPLPATLAHMVGRSDEVGRISKRLKAGRLVTIVGSGGVGKTTVAVAVAHGLLEAFAGAAVFVDLGMLSDPTRVAPSLASMLGLSVQSEDPTPSLTAYLKDKRVLLILDSCEHVIEGAARLAESILVAAPAVCILATSREVLRVEGEWVHRMEPLALPPEAAGLTVAEALTYPATRLFMDRTVASGAMTEFADAEAAVVAQICRKLDGVALAIELAAGRVAAYGLETTATLLDQKFALEWAGKRTAPLRQRSLNATLDWSYGLLSDLERSVLHRLAIFVGPFTLEAAQAVAADATTGVEKVLDALEGLVGKSMVSPQRAGTIRRYRLLDTTRAYLREGGHYAREFADVALRHATYQKQWLEGITAEGVDLSDASARAAYLRDLNDVRAALAWSFGEDGNTDLGVSLAAAAAPVFFAMSLLTDCQHWSQRALLALDMSDLGERREMRLQAAQGLALMWTRGNGDATYAALNRGIVIARNLGDTLNQIRLFAPLHVFHLMTGDFKTAFGYAEQVTELSRDVNDPAAIGLARILLGYSLHFAGDLSGARRELDAALGWSPVAARPAEPKGDRSSGTADDAMAAPILTLAWSAAPSALARTLWLEGRPAEAMAHVNQTISDAEAAEHPVTLVVALIYAISVLLMTGDLDAAEAQIARLIKISQSYSLRSQLVLGRCFEGQLAILRGEAGPGLQILRENLEELRALRYGLLTTAFNISYAQALDALGRAPEALGHIDQTLRSAEIGGDHCHLPELLRVKAGLQSRLPDSGPEAGAATLAQSLAISRRQGARAWELRTVIDLARRAAAEGRTDRARTLLRPVYDQFGDGSQTADLKIAADLLRHWA